MKLYVVKLFGCYRTLAMSSPVLQFLDRIPRIAVNTGERLDVLCINTGETIRLIKVRGEGVLHRCDGCVFLDSNGNCINRAWLCHGQYKNVDTLMEEL